MSLGWRQYEEVIRRDESYIQIHHVDPVPVPLNMSPPEPIAFKTPVKQWSFKFLGYKITITKL